MMEYIMCMNENIQYRKVLIFPKSKLIYVINEFPISLKEGAFPLSWHFSRLKLI